MLKETAADIEVKRGLWASIQREIMGFAQRYAEARIRGVRYSEEQKDITFSAKAKGYPKGLIRTIWHQLSDGVSEGSIGIELKGYRQKIGLFWPDRSEKSVAGAQSV